MGAYDERNYNGRLSVLRKQDLIEVLQILKKWELGTNSRLSTKTQGDIGGNALKLKKKVRLNMGKFYFRNEVCNECIVYPTVL